jgi:hypothetical protein
MNKKDERVDQITIIDRYKVRSAPNISKEKP